MRMTKWTEEEDQFIIENYGRYSAKEIYENIYATTGIERSYDSIKRHIGELRRTGCIEEYRFMPYTEEEDEIIRDYYPNNGIEKTMQKIFEETGIKRSSQSITSRAKKFKIHISDERRHNSHKSELGTISLRSEGTKTTRPKYYYIKVKDNDGNDKWISYHRYLLGDEAQDKRVIFLNNNNLDVRPENMVCVTRSTVSKMVANKYYSDVPEITKTGILICELIEAMKQQEKEVDSK